MKWFLVILIIIEIEINYETLAVHLRNDESSVMNTSVVPFLSEYKKGPDATLRSSQETETSFYTQIELSDKESNMGPGPPYSVRSVGPAQELAAIPILLPDSDHELVFNVTWKAPLGDLPEDYSLEINSTTFTSDCNTPMCYEYNIPGDTNWWLVPSRPHPYADSCAVRPGCSYRVRLIGHPWDGHTSSNLDVTLDECVAGVCSCGHSPRLPVPLVTAQLVSLRGELHVNVTWRLPLPSEPYRLPPGLQKQRYYVSIGKQMVSDAHPAPWFSHTINRSVETDGSVADGDATRSIILPLIERDEYRKVTKTLMLDVRLLARVILVDERNCLGPAGNATAYDPTEASKNQHKAYALWATIGGTCVLAVMLIFAVGARGIKRLLNALRPAPVSTPLEPLRLLPAWLPLQNPWNVSLNPETNQY